MSLLNLCRMVTGSPAQTTPLHEIGHRCLGMDDYPYTAEFPPSPELCTGGVRSEATFPACWDGVNLGRAGLRFNMLA